MYSQPEFPGLWRLQPQRWEIFVSKAVDGSLIYRPLLPTGALSNDPRFVSELPEGGWEVARYSDQYVRDKK